MHMLGYSKDRYNSSKWLENHFTLQSHSKLELLSCMLMCIYREVVVHCLLVACHFEQIRKAYVDHFSSGQMIPKCELLLRWPHKDKPHVCLEHDIELEGAKGCSYFTLYIPDAGERCQVVKLYKQLH